MHDSTNSLCGAQFGMVCRNSDVEFDVYTRYVPWRKSGVLYFKTNYVTDIMKWWWVSLNYKKTVNF